MKWVKCSPSTRSRYRVVLSEVGLMIEFQPCGVQSFSDGDIQHHYCAYCHRFVYEEAGSIAGGE